MPNGINSSGRGRTKLPAQHLRSPSGYVFHAGAKHTLCQLRQFVWITKGLQAVKSVVNTCFRCQKNFKKNANQRMANLPSNRINPAPVLTETGLDMSADAIVNAIIRFAARRPGIRRFTSDCGTNLVGANNILKKEMEAWNRSSTPAFDPAHGHHIAESLLREASSLTSNAPLGVVKNLASRLPKDFFASLNPRQRVVAARQVLDERIRRNI